MPARVRWASLAAILIALAGALVNLKLESDYQQTARDPYMVNMQTERLAGVLAAVPPEAQMGYMTDLERGSSAYQAAFNSARYALAPRIVAPGFEGEWALGNFAKPADFAALGREKGLELVRDFGNGAVLYRRLR